MTRRLVALAAAFVVLFAAGTVVVYLAVRPHVSSSTLASSQPVGPSVSVAPTTPTAPPSPSSAGSATPGDAVPAGEPYTQTAAARQGWEPVVTGFGKAFSTGTSDAKAWRTRLDRYSTADLRSTLDGVDPGDIPKGSYAGYDVVKYDETQLSVVLSYDQGWAIVASVITDGSGWKVYRYDRWEA